MLQRIMLNKTLRYRIMINVMTAWVEEHPKPNCDMMTNEGCKRHTEYRNAKNEYQKRVTMALSSFRNLKQLMDEWPEMFNFVPTAVIRPQDIKLPTAPKPGSWVN